MFLLEDPLFPSHVHFCFRIHSGTPREKKRGNADASERGLNADVHKYKQGITMTMEQYAAFVAVLPQVEGQLVRMGEKNVVRPEYGAEQGKVKVEDEDDADEEQEGSEGRMKANIEATSDEDEG